ncbi:MAG: thermonuclease family protein [Geminicoccaceae bacterium]
MGADACCDTNSDGIIILILVVAAGIYYWRAKYWITGKAVAISGHTLLVGDKLIRLHALNALHIGYRDKPAQPWTDHNGVRHNGGEICRNALAQLIAGKKVKCRLRQSGGPYRRYYAQAFIDDCDDVGQWMVEHGYAVADPRFHRRYVSAQRKARKVKNGIWRGTFEDPIIWGRRQANELVFYPAYRRRFPKKPAPNEKLDFPKLLELGWDGMKLLDPTTALLSEDVKILTDLFIEP